MTDHVDAALAHLVLAGDHLVTLDDARPERRADRGELVRLARGVYAPASLVDGLMPWQRAELRVRAVAGVRVLQPLARRSAARVWGVPLLGQVEQQIHALAWNSRSGRTSGEVRYWSTNDDETRIVRRRGCALTDLPRTLAELCVSESFTTAVAAVDWGIRVRGDRDRPRTTIDEIRSAAEELMLVRGRARLERALSFADGRAESPGESWSRVVIHRLGFVAPDLQHPYRGRAGQAFRSDFHWEDARLAGEFDGWGKYLSPELRDGRSAERVVLDEKLREDDIRSTGDSVTRWGIPELSHPAMLERQLASAGVPFARRRRSARFTR